MLEIKIDLGIFVILITINNINYIKLFFYPFLSKGKLSKSKSIPAGMNGKENLSRRFYKFIGYYTYTISYNNVQYYQK